MRKLQGLVLAFMVLAFVAPAIAADSGALKSGPAGAVEVKRGQPIEIRALLSDTVVDAGTWFSWPSPGRQPARRGAVRQ